MLDLKNYKILDIVKSPPKIGDVVYHPQLDRIEIAITEQTDILQEEVYPMVENFGCLLLRQCKQSFEQIFSPEDLITGRDYLVMSSTSGDHPLQHGLYKARNNKLYWEDTYSGRGGEEDIFWGTSVVLLLPEMPKDVDWTLGQHGRV